MIGTRPNIVLIHCHDLGRWLSSYGHPGIPSPNLQKLSEHGVVFETAFSTSPLCTPARSSLFTGMSPHVNGLMGLTHQGWRYRDGVITLPEMLSNAGYRTALIGLQHEDFDARVLGFDEVHGLGFLPRALEVSRWTQKWFAGLSMSDPRPYFLTIGMWETHRPWPDEDYEPVPPETTEVPPYLPDNEHTRNDLSHFYGSIRQMDEAVGNILDAIDNSAGGAETLVIFTTDHGAAFPRAKSTLYDSGVGVALIVRPPVSWKIAPSRIHAMVSHLDIVPTLAELAGTTPRTEIEGQSLVPLLTSDARPDDRELVFEKTYHDGYDPIRAIRTSTAKYIRNFVAGPRLPLPLDLEGSETRAGMDDSHCEPRPPEELYLLEEDPWELSNRAGDPELSELQQDLSRRLFERMQDTHDPLLDGGRIPEPTYKSRNTPSAVDAFVPERHD